MAHRSRRKGVGAHQFLLSHHLPCGTLPSNEERTVGVVVEGNPIIINFVAPWLAKFGRPLMVGKIMRLRRVR